MIGIPLGLLAANATEWVVHKYVLHGLAQNKGSFWSFHWHDHHRNVRKNDHVDPDYQAPLFSKWNGQSKEALALVGTAIAGAALFPVAPFFAGTVLYSAINYYRKHKRAHLDPAWAREHLPWHYDHHMGPNQHANWCVTRPWFDHIMGTREPFVGTEAEKKSIEKRERVRAAANAPIEPSIPVAQPA